MFSRRRRPAFTLLEVLLAVSVVSALAIVVIAAVNPREGLRRAFDAERRSHVNALIKALNNYHWTEGKMPQESAIPAGASNAKPVCGEGVSEANCSAEDGVSLDLLVTDYLTAVPEDRAEPCENRTGYLVYQEGGRALALAAHLGRLPGEAPFPEGGCGAFVTGTDGCPHPNDEVYAVVRAGGITYIGGAFTNVGGHPRKRLAALDSSCALTSWNPGVSEGASDTVHAIAVAGSTVYVGGEFTSVGGQPRNRIAAIDANGTVLPWNPNANSKVLAIAVDGSTVYAGGEFTTIGGASRNSLAALDAGGTATGWNPNPNARVLAVAVDSSNVYVGGEFTSVGGQPRNRIAQVQSDGTVTNWDPNANAPVRALLVSAPNVYIGGDFTVVSNDKSRGYGAKINPGENPTAWNPNANNPVHALAVHGSTILLGGHFTQVGGQTRNRLARVDDNNGTVQSWNPDAQDDVHALIVDGSNVFLGGKFQSVGGDASLSRFARIAAP